jgi:hypothetical protein
MARFSQSFSYLKRSGIEAEASHSIEDTMQIADTIQDLTNATDYASPGALDEISAYRADSLHYLPSIIEITKLIFSLYSN